MGTMRRITLALPFLALLAVTATSSAGAGGRLRMLPRRGRQERGVCTAEGRCFNKVVTCPGKCPERRLRQKGQQTTCIVDCAGACAATCKTPTHKPSNAYQTWCNKTDYASLCTSVAESDPRESLKTSPKGLVVILVSVAQAKATATRLFINESLHVNQTTSDSDVLSGCLLAYNLDWVNTTLTSVDIHQVSDQQRCSDLNDSLQTVVSEVTYDCEWDLPNPKSPTLSQLYQNVELLASIVNAARQILSAIGCGQL